jgi:hypothetical protein
MVMKKKKEKKITIKYFVNTKLKSPKIISTDEYYPVYIQVFYNRQTLTFRSRFLTDFLFSSQDSFEESISDVQTHNQNNSNYKSMIEEEIKLITVSIRDLEKSNQKFTHQDILKRLDYFARDIFLELKWLEKYYITMILFRPIMRKAFELPISHIHIDWGYEFKKIIKELKLKDEIIGKINDMIIISLKDSEQSSYYENLIFENLDIIAKELLIKDEIIKTIKDKVKDVIEKGIKFNFALNPNIVFENIKTICKLSDYQAKMLKDIIRYRNYSNPLDFDNFEEHLKKIHLLKAIKMADFQHTNISRYDYDLKKRLYQKIREVFSADYVELLIAFFEKIDELSFEASSLLESLSFYKHQISLH